MGVTPHEMALIGTFFSPATGRAVSLERGRGASGTAAIRATEAAGDYADFIKALVGGRTGTFTAQTAYERTPAVYLAVNLRAKALADVPYVIRRGAQTVFDSDGEDEGDQLPKDLAYLEDLPTLFRLSEAALISTGCVRIHKETPAGSRRVDRLRWYDPRTVTFNPQDPEEFSPAKGILKYRRRVEGRPDALIDPADLITIDYPDPFVEIGPGTPPMRAALNAADVLDAYYSFVAGHVRTGLVKNLFFAEKDPSGQGRTRGEAELSRFKRGIFNWLRRRGRIESAEDVQVLSDQVEIHEVGEGLRELAAKDFTQEFWRGISASFGVPFGLMFENAANYATMMLQLYQLYMTEVFPDCSLIERAFNRDLLLPIGYRLRFQRRRVEAVQWAEVNKAQAVSLLTGGAPVLEAEEAEQLFGLFPARPRKTPAATNGEAT